MSCETGETPRNLIGEHIQPFVQFSLDIRVLFFKRFSSLMFKIQVASWVWERGFGKTLFVSWLSIRQMGYFPWFYLPNLPTTVWCDTNSFFLLLMWGSHTGTYGPKTKIVILASILHWFCLSYYNEGIVVTGFGTPELCAFFHLKRREQVLRFDLGSFFW